MLIRFNKLFKRIRSEEGFTLVELLVVMAILAVLAALAVPRFGQMLEDSKYKTHNENVVMIYKAGEMYLASHGNPAADIDIAALKTAGFLTSSDIATPYNAGTKYTCAIKADGSVTVTPGLATKSGTTWTAATDYKGP